MPFDESSINSWLNDMKNLATDLEVAIKNLNISLNRELPFNKLDSFFLSN
jgi:hypothetical protein